jgi:heat shock protein HslJ
MNMINVATIRAMVITLVVVAVASAITIKTAGFAGQTSSGLSGTSWQLVKFQGSDDTVVPDDRSKYTITFGSNGRVSTRVDCNRGGSTWKAIGTSELRFGSWSRTTAKCGPGSLHDKIVNEGANVRSYVIKDGHLFLSGMASGGFYELEPLSSQRPRSSGRGRH